MGLQIVGGLPAQRTMLSGNDGWSWLSARAMAALTIAHPSKRRSWPHLRAAYIRSTREQQPALTRLARPDETRGDASTPGDTSVIDLAAFDRFYTRHEQSLYGYVRRLTSSDEIAVELAQETFFRAWRHFATLSGYERPEAWLYRVATNLAMSHLRRRRPLNFSALFARAPSGANAEGDNPAGEEHFAAPFDMEGQAAERDAIDRILRALPERQRAALLLAAVQGFSSDEIAEAMNATPANARQILSRARERFRRLYNEAQRQGD